MVFTGVLLGTSKFSSGNSKFVSKANTLVGLWDRLSTGSVLVPLELVFSFDELDLLAISFLVKLELLHSDLEVLG